MKNSKAISVKINGKQVEKTIPTHLRLLDFIRNNLKLTGTKEVCGEGECGACSVILAGKIVNSCLIFAVETNGSEISTIEGIAKVDELSEIQQNFIEHHSVQCGFCIPGMVLAGEEIRKENPNSTRDEIKEKLAGNICRCTGYKKIVDAIENN